MLVGERGKDCSLPVSKGIKKNECQLAESPPRPMGVKDDLESSFSDALDTVCFYYTTIINILTLCGAKSKFVYVKTD